MKKEKPKNNQQKVKQLLEMLSLRTFDNPLGLFTPNLNALVANTAWALNHPQGYTPVYLTNLWETVGEVEECLHVVRTALREDPHKNLMLSLAAKPSLEKAKVLKQDGSNLRKGKSGR